MSYYREDETQRMLENQARWCGDRPGVQSSASILDRLRRELRRDSGLPIPVLAADAWHTERALKLMGLDERVALQRYHLTNLPFADQVRKAQISKRGLVMRLHRAHAEFWSAFDAIRMRDSSRMYNNRVHHGV